MDDPTVGTDPILDPGPIVEINGESYPVRRLGIRDTFRVARIVGAGVLAMNKPLNTDDLQKEEVIMELLAAGMVRAEGEVIGLLADVIGVKADELTDPERFPMGSEIDIIQALANSQDLKAFFTKLGKLIKQLPEAQTAATRTA